MSQQGAAPGAASVASGGSEANNAQGGSGKGAKGPKAGASLRIEKEKRRKSTATQGQEKAGSVLQSVKPVKCVLQYGFRSSRNEPPQDY